MKVEVGQLKCVKLLANRGIEAKKAEVIVETLTDIELRNLYNKEEIDGMMNATVKNTLLECRREFDKELGRRNKEFRERMRMLERKNREELKGVNKRAADDSARMEKRAADDAVRMEKQAAADLAEARNSRRWQTGIIVSTIVVAWTSLAGLMHYIH